MELRKAEENISNIINDYNSLVGVAIPNTILWKHYVDKRNSVPALIVKNSNDAADDTKSGSNKSASLVTDWLPTWGDVAKHQKEESDEGNKEMECDDNETNIAIIAPSELLAALETIQDQIDKMKGVATKFRERMAMKDPVTNAPRYGAKTMERVASLIHSYDALCIILDIAFYGKQLHENNEQEKTDCDSEKKTPVLVDILREEISLNAQENDAKAQNAKRQEQLKRNEEERKKRELLELEQQRQRDLESAKRAEREELAKRAEEAKRQRLELERREREAEIAFVEKVIGRGTIEGVKTQLAVLRQSCSAAGGDEFATAIGALHTLFSQINAKPEEVQFRKIRRDHPKFLEDIGRHEGGQEVLIAAGFLPQVVDDGIKCLVLKEPNIEHDMDGWSAWFDLMKVTLEVIEGELVKG